MSGKTVWVVDGYLDKVTQREWEAFRKQENNRLYPSKNQCFPSEDAAWQFVLNRATNELKHAIASAKKAEIRVKKCSRKMLEAVKP